MGVSSVSLGGHCPVDKNPEPSLQNLFRNTLSSIRRSLIFSVGGTGGLNKTDEFSEKFQRGGKGVGSFSIKKFKLQILDIYTGP